MKSPDLGIKSRRVPDVKVSRLRLLKCLRLCVCVCVCEGEKEVSVIGLFATSAGFVDLCIWRTLCDFQLTTPYVKHRRNITQRVCLSIYFIMFHLTLLWSSAPLEIWRETLGP